jgi:predicted MFS family arabinose efflux permease
MYLVTSYVRMLRSLSHNAKMWLLSGVIAGASWSISNVLFPLYLVNLGYMEDRIGLFSSVTSLAIGLTAIPAGLMLRGRRRKPYILVSSLSAGVFTLVQIMWPSELVLISMNAAFGIFHVLLIVSESPFIMENSRPEERSHLFSLNFIAVFSMFIVGSIFAGRLPALVGRLTGMAAESLPAFQIALLFGIILRFAATAPLAYIRETQPVASDSSARQGFFNLRSAGTIRKLCVTRLAWALGCGLFVPFIPVLLKTRLNADTAEVGSITALVNAACTFGCLLSPALQRTLGMTRAISMTIIIAAPVLVATGFARTLWFAGAMIVLREFLTMSTGPLRQRFSMEAVTREEQPVMASIDQVAWQLPWAAGAWLGGQLIGWFGYEMVFSLAALLYVVAGVLYGTMFRVESRRMFEAGV